VVDELHEHVVELVDQSLEDTLHVDQALVIVVVSVDQDEVDEARSSSFFLNLLWIFLQNSLNELFHVDTLLALEGKREDFWVGVFVLREQVSPSKLEFVEQFRTFGSGKLKDIQFGGFLQVIESAVVLHEIVADVNVRFDHSCEVSQHFFVLDSCA
jgi:hypothetical protein